MISTTRISSSSSSSQTTTNNVQQYQRRRRSQQEHLLHAESDAEDSNCIGVGIDLGTTNSAVSILKDGIPVIIEIEGNGRTMPSVVHIGDDGETVYVGKEAVEREMMYPLSTYRNVKRIMGTGNKIAQDISNLIPNMVITEEEVVVVKKWKKRKKKKKKGDFESQQKDAVINPAMLYSTTTTQEEDGTATTTRTKISPELVSSHILTKLLDTAAAHTGKTIDRAVIGVPAYFTPTQKDATIRACNLAGIEKVKLLYEPEAAALNYNTGKEQIGQGETDELVFVFDLGGGTYDVSMLRVGGGLTEVLATHGNAMLGGSDFDYRIAQYLNKIIREHKSTNNINTGGEKSFLGIPEVRNKMILAAEAARIHLSNNQKVRLALPLAQDGWTSLAEARDIILKEKQEETSGELPVATETHVYAEITRITMEKICEDDIQALMPPIRECAIRSGALLPGDASPRVADQAFETEKIFQAAVKEEYTFDDFYDEEGSSTPDDADGDNYDDLILQARNIDLKEAKKIALRGRKKSRKVAKEEKKFRSEKRKIQAPNGKKLHEITGRPISRVVLVGGATRMPTIGRIISKLTGVVPQRTVNPDEAVAMGCAIQAGMYDNNEDMEFSTILTPMQAAIMKMMLRNQEKKEMRLQKQQLREELMMMEQQEEGMMTMKEQEEGKMTMKEQEERIMMMEKQEERITMEEQKE